MSARAPGFAYGSTRATSLHMTEKAPHRGASLSASLLLRVRERVLDRLLLTLKPRHRVADAAHRVANAMRRVGELHSPRSERHRPGPEVRAPRPERGPGAQVARNSEFGTPRATLRTRRSTSPTRRAAFGTPSMASRTRPSAFGTWMDKCVARVERSGFQQRSWSTRGHATMEQPYCADRRSPGFRLRL